MKRPDIGRTVYLDHAATTPVDARVREAMAACLADGGAFANPSSNHVEGRRSAAAVEHARDRVAALINARPGELYWTSGATESDNLAILGAARIRAHRGKHLVTMPTEHKAVVESFRQLEREGFDVTWLEPAGDGILRLDALDAAIRADTQLVSIMHVNNETGVTQDIEAIGEICRQKGVLFHCDAAQSAGKLPLDMAAMPVDLLSLTAHKFYGPQGIGALFVADRPGNRLEPLMFGGAQERRLRPGTLAVHQIIGLGAAAEIAHGSQASDIERLRALRARLWQGIGRLRGVAVNGSVDDGYPGIVNVSADGVDGESLMLALEPVCVATGSACNAQSGESSFVLRALGRSDDQAQSAIRFSFGRDTTDEDVDLAVQQYGWALHHLRAIGPARGCGT